MTGLPNSLRVVKKMTNNEFQTWLRGFFELSEEDSVLNPDQVQIIVNHLNLAEAVSGELDTKNMDLRVFIDAFRGQPKPIAPKFFEIFTTEIRRRALSGNVPENQ